MRMLLQESDSSAGLQAGGSGRRKPNAIRYVTSYALSCILLRFHSSLNLPFSASQSSARFCSAADFCNLKMPAHYVTEFASQSQLKNSAPIRGSTQLQPSRNELHYIIHAPAWIMNNFQQWVANYMLESKGKVGVWNCRYYSVQARLSSSSSNQIMRPIRIIGL